MLSAAFHLIPYAIVAALSPLGFAATIAVMRSGRLKALGFAVGFVAGQLLACSVLVLIGAATVPRHRTGYPTFRALVELGFGIALFGLAVIVHRRSGTVKPESSGRSKAALERLGRLGIFTTSAVGLLLGIGGPKRLVLSGLACAAITTSGLDSLEWAALVGWYVTLATVLVWLPILLFVILGERAVASLDAGQHWLARHQPDVTLYCLVILGLAVVADAIVALA
jgi:hypothetical protein